MGASPPALVAVLVERFSRDRKACPERSRRVFLSTDYKEEQLLKAKTPHEQESLRRTIAATDKAIDALVYELYGLKEAEVCIVEAQR